MRVYRDSDADLNLLKGRTIAVIGYGNQGRAQALNLRDSGLEVLIGNREDEYAHQARQDGFSPLTIEQAARQAEIILLLIPDEVMQNVFESAIVHQLEPGKALGFASGYTVAFQFVKPPPDVDVVLVAPRMIGAGVRDLYLQGNGFPSFFGVWQDYSGKAKEIALALAKGIGSTRMGAVEVTFAQEAELDLFTEQCFGPAFGQVLMTAVDLLLENNYPPEAVLLELYMSGEFSYTLAKIAEMGLIEQSQLHSRTSQYGSISRGMRFILPELRVRMQQGLEEIRSGEFAKEWAEEYAAGCPTMESLKEAARSLPLYQLERELRSHLGSQTIYKPMQSGKGDQGSQRLSFGIGNKLKAKITALTRRQNLPQHLPSAREPLAPKNQNQMRQVLQVFTLLAADDPTLRDFAQNRQLITHFILKDLGLEFYLSFSNGKVESRLGTPPSPAEVCLETTTEVLDGMFTGRIDATRAALTGKLSFSGDARAALSMQRLQKDYSRLYQAALRQAASK